MITNNIKVGDKVHIAGTFTMGEVKEIDDHPLEYAMLKIGFEGAGGYVEVWESCRLACKLNPDKEWKVTTI